jgi:hypothetical protein
MLVLGTIILLFGVSTVSAINTDIETIKIIENNVTPTTDVDTFTPTDDTYIAMNSPDGNNGDLDLMCARNRYGYPYHPNYWECNILIMFDISSIPSNAIINSAKLYLFYFTWGSNNPIGRDLTLYSISNDWDESIVTWNNRPNFDPIISSSAIAPSSPSVWMVWNVTSDVEKFVKGEKTNFGWQIMDEEYWGDFDIPITKFRTKEYSDNEYFPYLEIEFTRVRSRDITNPFFFRLFERFSNAFPILRQLLGFM